MNATGTGFLTEPQTVAEELALALRRHKVELLFGQSLPPALILACHRAGIRQVSYRTENMGGAMADGYARVSHRIGVVTAQNGPAATLLVPPLAEALKASIPVVALVQDVMRANRDRNAFQELDQLGLFAPVAKWVERVDVASRAVDYLDRAVVAATSGRPGPAVLLLPQDLIWEDACADGARKASYGHYPLDRAQPEAQAVETAARMIAEAANPIVVAGGGVLSSQAWESLSALQDAASLPVATTVMGKGAVAETHPLSLGVLAYFSGTGGLGKQTKPLVQTSDLLVLIGSRTNQNGTDDWRNYPKDARVIHIDQDGEEIGRNYEADLRMIGDARATLIALTAALERQDLGKRRAARPALEARIAAAKSAARREAAAQIESAASPLRPERILAEIAKQLDGESLIVTDASYSSVWVANYLEAERPGQRFITPRGLAGLGWGLPMAIGAKAARPEARLICLVGDGGFGHSWVELETLVRSDMAFPIVVLNNGILGFQKHAESARYGAYSDACDLAPVDHAALARACGCYGVAVDSPEGFAKALAKALVADKATVIDVATDQNAYPPLNIYEEAQVLGGRRSEPLSA
ncbi:MAG: acetolactate synthase catalytic subunit [Rhodospirillales bacterium]